MEEGDCIGVTSCPAPHGPPRRTHRLAVGATMVGSIVTLGQEGEEYPKGACNGYFKFGGR